MNFEKTWSNMIAQLSENPVEVPTAPSNTRHPVWFNACIDNGELYIQNAISHTPSTQLPQRRKITKSAFATIHAYYVRWMNGEKDIRHEARTQSMNTTYIFALIKYFEIGSIPHPAVQSEI